MQKQYRECNDLKVKRGQALESAITGGKYPAGGMAAVQIAVRSELDRLTFLVNSFDEDADIDDIREAYEMFVEALITGFYAFMFQGRIGAILKMLISDYNQLVVTSAAVSTQFKKSAQNAHVYQPIILPRDVKQDLLFFYDRVRPLLRLSGISRDALLTGFLFPSWGNVESSSTPDVIPSFTQRTMGIRLTSTNLRAVMETEAEQAWRDGRITEGQRSSVRSVNGHGSRVQYYEFYTYITEN
jgi:hypothetical protein